MKTIQSFLVLSLTLTLCTAQASEPFTPEAFKEDVEFLKGIGEPQDNTCYKIKLGELVHNGNAQEYFDKGKVTKMLGEGLSVQMNDDCVPAKLESASLEIVYNDGTKAPYPVDQLKQVKAYPGTGERLLYNAASVVVSDIVLIDDNGVKHQLGQRVFGLAE